MTLIQSTNQVSLYRQIDSNMIEAAGIEVSTPQFFYNTSEGVKEIELGEEFDNVLTINEFDTEWSPKENDLTVKQKFTFANPSVLFGDKGVTMNDNKIGLAVHIHSKTSGNQKKINFGSQINTQNKMEVQFEYNFPKDSIRGIIGMDFFMYLQDIVETRTYHANQIGMRLSAEDLSNLIIVVDGEGSAFPITEFNEKNGPLWILEKKWADATEDIFDSSNVNLSLNIVHPLFEQIKGGKTKAIRALMGDIMVQAMSMLIQQVLIIEENTLDAVDESISNSILAVVKYWVTTFEVDTTSLFTIMNSLRRRLDHEMLGGE